MHFPGRGDNDQIKEYHGFDISPTVAEKAKEALRDYKNATVAVLDMVKETVSEQYDAALDCMGFHMLVTDMERAGFHVEKFMEMDPSSAIQYSASIYVRKTIV